MNGFAGALIVAALLSSCFAAEADELKIAEFSSGSLSGWEIKPYQGKTDYSFTIDNGRKVLKAVSSKAASGYVKKIKVDPKRYPTLRWSWKVDHSLEKENVDKKEGDDFAARVYVVFPRSFFWRMRAINYVWSSKMPQGSHAPSPYTDNSIILAVESGNAKAGTWVMEERNIYEDYKNMFGEEPPKAGAIAIMTDTDDTGDRVTAWYGDIFLRENPL